MIKDLTILLVEDDSKACDEIAKCIDDTEGISLIDITNDSVIAAEIIRDGMPDVVILDLELHRGNGNGLFLLQTLREFPPIKMPYILVTTNNSSITTYEFVRQLGADFILSKHQQDYSAKMVIDLLRAISDVILKCADNRMAQGYKEDESSDRRRQRLTRRICSELNAVGINPKAIGYQYLVEGILIVIQAPTVNLCDRIGEKYHKTSSSVERAMKNAIVRTWRNQPIDDLLHHYTAKVSPERGIPTVTEFIYYYANKIKNDN